MIYIYILGLAVSFGLLFKCAGLFIEGACGIASLLKVSKMVVGIVLVGLATTAPEFCVSVIAAFLGHPEIALGNAVGSVICDDGFALALAAVVAPVAIKVDCRILKTAALFLLSIDILAYLLAKNGTIGRMEGILFVLLLVMYFILLIRDQKSRMDKNAPDKESTPEIKKNLPGEKTLGKKPIYLFAIGIGGVIITSRIIVWSSIHIARYFSVSETVIGLTIVALGTSLPEVSTCITAAIKGEGEIAVGDIIGADVLNILWIIGMSSIVNPIKVEKDIINFMFPFMILVVSVMLGAMRMGCRLGKIKGFLLFGLYVLYVFLTLKIFT